MTNFNKLVMKIAMTLFIVVGIIQLFASYHASVVGGRFNVSGYSIGIIGIPCDIPTTVAGVLTYCYCDVAPLYGAMLLAFAYFAYRATRELQQKLYFDLVMIYTIGQIILIAHDYLKGHWTWWVMLLLLCYGVLMMLLFFVRKSIPNVPDDIQ
jgi:hypothetical protein